MAADFNPLARLYRYLEYAMFGPALWRRRKAYLSRLTGVRYALMVGEGDGRFLSKFLEENPAAYADYLDASFRMLALAQARLVGSSRRRARFTQGDVLAEPTLGSGYDAIITHFFLDCFDESEVRSLAAILAARANPTAVWVVSEFQTKPPGASWLVSGLYLFFRWTTGLQTQRLPDHRSALTECGFHLLESEESLGGLLVSELWRRAE
jgi:SAM-dependent methyltransferase